MVRGAVDEKRLRTPRDLEKRKGCRGGNMVRGDRRDVPQREGESKEVHWDKMVKCQELH